MLISLAVRFADHAPTLGSSLSVAAFNVGTAVCSWLAALALESALGATGPAVLGTAIAALTLIPAIALARTPAAARQRPPRGSRVLPPHASRPHEPRALPQPVGGRSADPHR